MALAVVACIAREAGRPPLAARDRRQAVIIAPAHTQDPTTSRVSPM
jgi:hypothetical protein